MLKNIFLFRYGCFLRSFSNCAVQGQPAGDKIRRTIFYCLFQNKNQCQSTDVPSQQCFCLFYFLTKLFTVIVTNGTPRFSLHYTDIVRIDYASGCVFI